MQDPVARTVSSHNMEYHANGRCYGDTCHRIYPPLLQEFRNNRDFNFTLPPHMANLTTRPVGCNFNELVRLLATHTPLAMHIHPLAKKAECPVLLHNTTRHALAL